MAQARPSFLLGDTMILDYTELAMYLVFIGAMGWFFAQWLVDHFSKDR